jgi:4-amino-4-deoxy-L-arabinose transferase-like glycosyltransferase
MRPTHPCLLVCAVTVVGLALRFWRLGEMPLFGDEAYYLLWADRLALSYFDHPAGIALLLKLSTLLGGASEFGVRWLNALLGAACVPLSYAVGRGYVSRRGGLIAAAAVAFGPVYVITGRVAYPDSLHNFLLLVSLIIAGPLLAGASQNPKISTRRWIALGLALACLLNVKLTTGFFGVAVALHVLARRRDLLRAGGLWLAASLALLGAAPIVVWNAGHDWGMLRLTIQQGANYGLPAPTLPAAWLHAIRYLTPPVALLAVIAAARLARRRLMAVAKWRKLATCATGDGPLFLAIAAACTLLPILLSAANSPRNLGFGLLLLWPLAGIERAAANAPADRRGKLRIGDWAVVACLTGSAIYAAGTTAALLGPAAWPRSSGAAAIRTDAAGWPALADETTLHQGDPLFAVDYSIAGQISYYTGRPVYSAAGQFRAWGIPETDRLVVLSQGFVPEELVKAQLQTGFSLVEGPERRILSQNDFAKELQIWLVRGRRAAMAEIVTSLDYLTLATKAAQGR